MLQIKNQMKSAWEYLGSVWNVLVFINYNMPIFLEISTPPELFANRGLMSTPNVHTCSCGSKGCSFFFFFCFCFVFPFSFFFFFLYMYFFFAFLYFFFFFTFFFFALLHYVILVLRILLRFLPCILLSILVPRIPLLRIPLLRILHRRILVFLPYTYMYLTEHDLTSLHLQGVPANNDSCIHIKELYMQTSKYGRTWLLLLVASLWARQDMPP